MLSTTPTGLPSALIQQSALVLSPDSIAAALVAAVAEAAGLAPHFLADHERARDAIRRLRPAAVIADCSRGVDAFVGPAMMCGARVALFCASRDTAAAARARLLAERYDVAFFLLPEDVDALEAYCTEVSRITSRPDTGS